MVNLFLKIFIFSIIIISLNANDKIEKVSLQLLWKHQFEFAGFYMAKEKGFYSQAGLDVEIKEFNFGMDIVSDVESGKSTFGIGYPSIIFDKTNGRNVNITAAIFQSSPHVLISLKSSGINNIKDFAGKRIMVNTNQIESASFLSMIKSQGVSFKDMKIQEHSFHVKDLIDKKTDIMSSYTSNELYNLDKLNIKYNIFDPKDYGFDLYSNLIFTSFEQLEQNPKRVSKFTEASLKGWEYAFDNIDETVDLILKKYNSQNKSKEALIYEANVLKKLAYKNNVALGNIDKNKIQRIYDIYALMGLTKEIIDIDEFIFDMKKNRLYLTAKEKKYLKQKQVIKMCVDPNWMPFEKIVNNEYIGIGSDFIKLFEKKLDVKFELVPTKSWFESKQKAKNRVCDILPISSITESRKKFMNVTTPYIKEPLSIATKFKTIFINDWSDLKNKKIGITKDYSIIKELRKKYPYLNIVETQSTKDGLEKVANGELFGQIDNLQTINYYIQSFYWGELKISGKFDELYVLGMASNKDDLVLSHILQKTVDNISKEEFNEISNKWLVQKEVVKEIDYSLLVKILFFVILIILMFIYWNFRLKVLVSQRTALLEEANEKLKEKSKMLEDLNKSLNDRVREEVETNRQNELILMQQSKMASLGEMIGNIAHQWRQPLSVISIGATGLKIQKEAGILNDEEFIETCDSINNNAQYLSNTIDDFRNFIVGDREEVKFNLNQNINSLIDFVLGKSKSHNVNIVTKLDKDIELHGFPNELLQCYINIFNNSFDAFNDKQKEKYIFISTIIEAENITVSFKDNAGGIPEDILPKIFDPYFTTKHKSQGTGLGLSMTYNLIVKGMKGHIVAHNVNYEYKGKKYKGAEFKISLPVF